MKAFTAFLSLILLTSLSAHAESRAEAERRLMREDAYEASYGKLFDEESYFRGETWLNQYVNVIVVNKAASGFGAQTLKLYTNRQLILETKVSTGREDVEYVTPISGFFRKFGKGSTDSHWRHTTRGFYSIKRVEGPNYRSSESKFKMPFAMFFNDKRGLAVHQVPPDLSGGEAGGNAMLGKRASGGCVRVHKDYIQVIYNAVRSADKGQIPVLNTRTGQPELDENGQVKYSKGWRTIVIVEEY